MNKIIKACDKVVSLILIVLVGFLAAGVMTTVVLRYFFGLSFSSLEEFLTMAFIFTTLFGSAISIRERQHIAISYFADKFIARTEKGRKIAVILVDLSILFVCLIMLIYSVRWIGQVGHLKSQNSHLPMSVYYIFMPITFAITIFYLVVDILGLYMPIDEPDSGYSTDDKLPEDEE
ncbi:MAG: TRAP transporter small permease [Sphaerochaetaceae bacterium]|nr:TRAP transporter small permease [Sphaerochaetaceae bacterium]